MCGRSDIKRLVLELREFSDGRKFGIEGIYVESAAGGASGGDRGERAARRRLIEIEGNVFSVGGVCGPFASVRDDVWEAASRLLRRKLGYEIDLSWPRKQKPSKFVFANDGRWFFSTAVSDVVRHAFKSGIEYVYVSRGEMAFFVKSTVFNDYIRLRVAKEIYPRRATELFSAELPEDAEPATVINLLETCGLIILTTDDRDFGIDYSVGGSSEAIGNYNTAWVTYDATRGVLVRTSDPLLIFDLEEGLLCVGSLIDAAFSGDVNAAEVLDRISRFRSGRVVEMDDELRRSLLRSAARIPLVVNPRKLPRGVVRYLLRHTYGMWAAEDGDLSAAIFVLPSGLAGFVAFAEGAVRYVAIGRDPKMLIDEIESLLAEAERVADSIDAMPSEFARLKWDDPVLGPIYEFAVYEHSRQRLERIIHDPSFFLLLERLTSEDGETGGTASSSPGGTAAA